MWRDECGFKHNGASPYEQRKLAEFRSRMTIEEKYKEKVEEALQIAKEAGQVEETDDSRLYSEDLY